LVLIRIADLLKVVEVIFLALWARNLR
jgi:hypothetical protein